MKFSPTRLSDVVMIEPRVFGDERGFFMETWQKERFSTAGISADFVQDNHSFSRQWVLRGLHYQIRRAQGKLVRVTHGEAFDIVVDMRRSSPTFGQWVGEILSESNRRMLWIPPGFAHGFLALSDQVELMYKCTDYYSPDDERCLLWNDPSVAVDWPLSSGVQPIISTKDAAGSTLEHAELYP
jgi:dTDP-4-dehydrorhamnose 3,5-epimerase